MFDKVYAKDNTENLKIFDDIERKKNFSNYSIELNRLFGDKSYDNFYKNLIENKKARCSNFVSMFQKPKNMAGLKIYEEPFNIVNFEEKLKKMKLKSEKLSYKVKNPYKSRPQMKSITKTKTERLLKRLKNKKFGKKNENSKNSKIKLKKDKIYLPEVPDVGRYNPSYDILRKHTYQACFSTSNFHDFNKNNTQFNDRNLFKILNSIDYKYNFYDNKIRQIYIQTNDINNITKTMNDNLSKNNKKTLNKNKKKCISTSPLFNNRKININIINSDKDELNNSSNIINDSQILIRTNGDIHSRCQKRVNNLYNTSSNFSFDDSKLNSNKSIYNSGIINLKNNHCLKFNNYSKRKPIINKLNYTVEHFTNAEAFNMNYPGRNNNACVEFNKLSTCKNKQKSYFEVEANKNKNPPLGAYNPKFESTFYRVTTNIFLDKNKIPLTNQRKLKKIMFNYNVPSKYLLFQSLNKKNK